jgi:hypothetical protein
MADDAPVSQDAKVMHLERLTTLELAYVGDFHYVTRTDGTSGVGWGRGEGTASGERLGGTVQWSNHPSGRADGAMLPGARGVISTDDGGEVLFDLTGRTVFVEVDGETVGRQLLMTLFEADADDERYAWLNHTVCMTEGKIDPVRKTMRLEVHVCHPDLT